jgi:hypothetical protein
MIGSGDSQGKGEHLNSTQAGTDKQPASQPMEHGELCSLNSMAATVLVLVPAVAVFIPFIIRLHRHTTLTLPLVLPPC